MQALLEKKRVSLGVLLSERVSSSEENVRRREDAVLFWLWDRQTYQMLLGTECLHSLATLD